MPSRMDSRSAPGRRSLTSSRSSTPEIAGTPPTRPSRARTCTLPRAEAGNVAGVPLAAKSAVRSIVPDARIESFERHATAAATGRSRALARPFTSSVDPDAVNVNGIVDPAHARAS